MVQLLSIQIRSVQTQYNSTCYYNIAEDTAFPSGGERCPVFLSFEDVSMEFESQTRCAILIKPLRAANVKKKKLAEQKSSSMSSAEFDGGGPGEGVCSDPTRDEKSQGKNRSRCIMILTLGQRTAPLCLMTFVRPDTITTFLLCQHTNTGAPMIKITKEKKETGRRKKKGK